ncbi:sn-glycerol-3-phosphate ABC transporter ATP-binding protein UgpC [Mesorhizobium sp. VK24D]|uniref:Sn-glycerol-3-phosphate ABC transporter ATP-binding protein UgpC n=1 Tax=Mesorhizobium album TaxID=3072314 RepID=A0ABU4XSX9_9HYPH|nr:sn-glycerol-3-phosphate ABC transporter ATP-binding protein UgpC [Mesorhizobium sp. VK24D]MDX8477486.1 sn-glycerol-3-phosphate ABC transporter ATP-binding protein UgpC [Mesorhizobium sp. VK24D]
MASVTISGVEKWFGTLEILHGIDIDIEDQEFVVLVGPSGCGKSTLLRMIAGLESISDGEISIGTRVINDVPARNRDIAMVFQNYALYPHMSVFDNIGFSLKLRKRSKQEISEKINEAAEILDLTPYLERSPRQLSGGQRQRVAMGRALVRDAQVFLFDEPLSNLDAKLRVVMRTEIKALHQRLKTTSVYVTHDQIEAMTMADRIVVMNKGRVEQIGTPMDLYDFPANLFVADFIGSPSMNFIKGIVAADNEGPFVTAKDGTRLAISRDSSAKLGQKVVYGARPEHLVLSGESQGFGATVEVIEPTGPNIQIFADVAGQRICALSAERRTHKPGQRIRLHCPETSVHLFDASSGARI